MEAEMSLKYFLMWISSAFGVRGCWLSILMGVYSGGSVWSVIQLYPDKQQQRGGLLSRNCIEADLVKWKSELIEEFQTQLMFKWFQRRPQMHLGIVCLDLIGLLSICVFKGVKFCLVIQVHHYASLSIKSHSKLHLQSNIQIAEIWFDYSFFFVLFKA